MPRARGAARQDAGQGAMYLRGAADVTLVIVSAGRPEAGHHAAGPGVRHRQLGLGERLDLGHHRTVIEDNIMDWEVWTQP
jgi:hypothetical protein